MAPVARDSSFPSRKTELVCENIIFTRLMFTDFSFQTIDKLPEKILLHIFSFLEHKDICHLFPVSRKWEKLAGDSRLWTHVSFRPEYSGPTVPFPVDKAADWIGRRFGAQLRYIELPIELITASVLQELSTKCPNLNHLVLDFSNAMQLHDFADLNAFPSKLHTLCLCLSDVIFMEGFMRRIYNFINSVETLQLIGKQLVFFGENIFYNVCRNI